MKKLLLVFGAIFLMAPAIMAQRTFSSAPIDSSARKKEPILIVTESNAGEFFENRKASNLSTSIKINPILLVFGDIPIYFEQKLAKKLTGEVGLGLTYKNYLGDLFDQLEMESIVKTENETGYSFSGALRYYPSAYDALEGYYFAPEIRHRVYNMRALECENTKINVKQSKTYTDFKLTFGYAEFVDDNILFDLYCGIGLGNRYYKNEVSGETIYRSYPEEDETIISVNDRSKTVPVFSCGIKFGFAF